MSTSTIERIDKINNKETPLTDEEREELARYNTELNSQLYGEGQLVASDSIEQQGEQAADSGEPTLTDTEVRNTEEKEAIATNIGAKDVLGGVGVDTEELRASGSYLREEVSEGEMTGAVTEGVSVGAGDIYAFDKNVEIVTTGTNEVLSAVGDKEVKVTDAATRTAAEMVEQKVVDGGEEGELLSYDRAVRAKNSLIGRRYTEAYMSGEVELFDKLPGEVAKRLTTDISNTIERYGSFEEAPSEALALIGERVVASTTIESSASEDEANPVIVYGDANGEIVVQTAEEVAEQIIEGDTSVIREIPDPQLRQEVDNYAKVLEIFYKSGIIGPDHNERLRLQEYLFEAFKVRETVE